jgi:hypothetical protein
MIVELRTAVVGIWERVPQSVLRVIKFLSTDLILALAIIMTAKMKIMTNA